MASSENMVRFFINVMVMLGEDSIEFVRESCRNILAFCGCRRSLEPLTSVWCAATTALLRAAWGGGEEVPIQSPEGIGASSTHKPLQALTNCPYKATILHEHHDLDQMLRRMIKTAKEDGSSEVESELTEVQLLFEDISSILSNVKYFK